MALRTDLTAGLIAAAFAIGSVPAVLAQTMVEAKTWSEAISVPKYAAEVEAKKCADQEAKLDCDKISKNADGSFSIAAVIR
ncbi:MAG TPA: hypothetical protein VKB88_16170, partial [Bryobacteraceae bacterium]|nr:hypothetical protein [Bryobacteraceae bacterium]